MDGPFLWVKWLVLVPQPHVGDSWAHKEYGVGAAGRNIVVSCRIFEVEKELQLLSEFHSVHESQLGEGREQK